MSAPSNVPQGFFGLPDINEIIDQAIKVLPPVIGDAVKDTVGKLLDPNEPINIGDPQPPGPPPIPVTPGTTEMSAVVKAIDAVLSALEVILKLSFLIPDQYEGPLKALVAALKTIRGWLD